MHDGPRKANLQSDLPVPLLFEGSNGVFLQYVGENASCPQGSPSTPSRAYERKEKEEGRKNEFSLI